MGRGSEGGGGYGADGGERFGVRWSQQWLGLEVVTAVAWLEVAIDARQQEMVDWLMCREYGRCDERVSGCGQVFS